MSQIAQSRHSQRELVAAHIDRDQRTQLFALAQQEDMSVSAILRRALRAYLGSADATQLEGAAAAYHLRSAPASYTEGEQ